MIPAISAGSALAILLRADDGKIGRRPDRGGGMMIRPGLEQRVASVEGRLQEQGIRMSELREELRAMREELRGELRALRDDMDRRFERVDQRFARLVGIVVTGFVAVIGTVAGTFWSLLQVVRG
jgi:hypothetical protein